MSTCTEFDKPPQPAIPTLASPLIGFHALSRSPGTLDKAYDPPSPAENGDKNMVRECHTPLRTGGNREKIGRPLDRGDCYRIRCVCAGQCADPFSDFPSRLAVK